jgi:hypothetical protein
VSVQARDDPDSSLRCQLCKSIAAVSLGAGLTWISRSRRWRGAAEARLRVGVTLRQMLKHRAEKWMPVFRKSDAKTKG